MKKQFASDVLEGLQAANKHISSKYFYDQKGDELFQEIMALDEYYLTRAEFEIFDTQKRKIRELFSSKGKFRLIELGAGDGLKTKLLLREFLQNKCDFEYVPVDISQNVLDELSGSLAKEMPGLRISPVCGDYFKILAEFKQDASMRNVVLFVGSNIGNFSDGDRHTFLQAMSDSLNRDDLALIGFDLKKDPTKILAAYNDSKGVTRNFNLNLLDRINRELGGDFDLSAFMHYPTYNPISGMAESHLLSTKKQSVELERLGVVIDFEAWEAIHLEISRKFSEEELKRLASDHAFEEEANLKDSNGYFVDAIWRIK